MAETGNELAIYEGNRQGARVTLKSTLRTFHEVCDDMEIGVRLLTEELHRAVADLDDLIITTEAGLARAGVPYEAPGAVLPAARELAVPEPEKAFSARQEPPTFDPAVEEAIQAEAPDTQEVITVEFERTRGDDAPTLETPLGKPWTLRRMDRR